MSLTPATRVAFFEKMDPRLRGDVIAKELTKHGYKVWGENYSETRFRSEKILEFSFNFNFVKISEFDFFTLTFFEKELSVRYHQNTKLVELIKLVFLIINNFDEGVSFALGCWTTNIDDFIHEANKKFNYPNYRGMGEYYDFSSLMKVCPAFYFINRSLIKPVELELLRKKGPTLFTEIKNGILVYDKLFFECVEKDMVIGRSGYEVKRNST
jgi:hypothetical protein